MGSPRPNRPLTLSNNAKIYDSEAKIEIDINRIVLCPEDFFRAMKAITPASEASSDV